MWLQVMPVNIVHRHFDLFSRIIIRPSYSSVIFRRRGIAWVCSLKFLCFYYLWEDGIFVIYVLSGSYALDVIVAQAESFLKQHREHEKNVDARFHLLLVIAVIVLVIQLIQGRRL
jgi:hypothetical protein